LAAILALLAWVGSQAYPSTEAVRLRNSLLIQAGQQADFDWTPENVPSTFHMERGTPAAEFVSAIQEHGVNAIDGDWEKALALSAILTKNAQDRGPIQATVLTSYRKITEEGRGYCSDFTEAYMALAHAAGLFAREWAFSFDGFGGHGHAVIEVYDHTRGKWLFLDVYNNVHAIRAATGEPISALEFRDYIRQGSPPTNVRRSGPGRLGYSAEQELMEYYSRGLAEWYLWWGNDVITYAYNPGVRAVDALPPAVEQLVAIALGVHPQIKVLLTPENARAFQRMTELRSSLILVALIGSLLFLVLLAQLIILLRIRKRPIESPAYV
jgi:transglutaminase-like putative cysteine protease